jgi:uncharacterized protein YkwD
MPLSFKQLAIVVSCLGFFSCGEKIPEISASGEKNPGAEESGSFNCAENTELCTSTNNDINKDPANDSETATSSDSSSGCEDGDRVCLVEMQILKEVNIVRDSLGKSKLSYVPEMSDESRKWSCEMARTGQGSHAGVQQRFINSGYKLGGENVAMRMPRSGETPEVLGKKINQQWVNSPGHYENMIANNFRFIGIGICFSGSQMWGTQMFSPGK